MVLQQGRPIPVWGWAKPGETITITFAGKPARGETLADGKWTITLPAAHAGAGGEVAVAAAGERRVGMEAGAALAGEHLHHAAHAVATRTGTWTYLVDVLIAGIASLHARPPRRDGVTRRPAGVAGARRAKR